jgi:hypothetical protein
MLLHHKGNVLLHPTHASCVQHTCGLLVVALLHV